MNRFLSPIFLLALFLMMAFSCSSSKKAQSEANLDDKDIPVQTIVPDTFVLPEMPASLTNSDDRAKFLVMHYWDRFDFADEKLILRPEVTEQAFVDYINILTYVPAESAEVSLSYTLEKAQANTAMYTHFASLFEKYLYEPNSPFHNEGFYIPVLRKVTESPVLNDDEKSRYSFQLEMAMKNTIGQKAADFTYTLASGATANLHSLKSEYVLLMFSNPGCHTCSAVIEQLSQSDKLNAALAMNSPTRTMLTILTVYPDNDLSEWTAHLPQMPVAWVHSYDKGMEITKKKLYNIRAIPTLYLLDKDKKVILKDAPVGTVQAFFSSF